MRRLAAGTLIVLAMAIGLLRADGPTESWDIAYIAGQKVGHIRTLFERREVDGQLVMHSRQESDLAIMRFGQKTEMRVITDSYEFEDGRLYAIDTRLKMGSEDRLIRGVLGDDRKLRLSSTAAGKTTKDTIDWSDDILGPFAAERMLADKPLMPDETRSFKTYLPEMNLVTVVTLTAREPQTTRLHDGKDALLLLVEQTTDKIPIKASLWVDRNGEVLKSSMMVAGVIPMTTYRVSKTEALGGGKSGETPFDLGEQTAVRPDKSITNPHATRAVRYRLELADERAAKTIPEAAYQRIIERNGAAMRVVVSRRTPAGEATAAGQPPGGEFLASNGFIQSDDPQIVATARQVIAGATGPWSKAVRLEKWVDANMSNRDFSVGLDSASTVMKTRRGDCTEHAVLLAALCRAAGVPARVAIGLVYVEPADRFYYHMWTEVYVHDGWFALDGTLGQGFIAGGHIKLGDASLKGASDLAAFLPFFEVFGKLKIFVESVEP